MPTTRTQAPNAGIGIKEASPGATQPSKMGAGSHPQRTRVFSAGFGEQLSSVGKSGARM